MFVNIFYLPLRLEGTYFSEFPDPLFRTSEKTGGSETGRREIAEEEMKRKRGRGRMIGEEGEMKLGKKVNVKQEEGKRG